MPESPTRISSRLKRCATLRLMLCVAAFLTLTTSIHADAGKPFSYLKKKLVADGFDAKAVESIYTSPSVKEDVETVRLFFRHREAKLDYSQFTSWWAIRKARGYLEENAETLDKVEKQFGVDKTVITAILLVETRLGVSVGKRLVLNTLSTLASLSDAVTQESFFKIVSESASVEKGAFQSWAKRKSEWAYAELTAYIKYTSRENLDPAGIPGSYAGALGIAQFMPSSILAYASDGNLDGRIDLFDHADAAASIASYLKHFGWHPDIDREKASKVIFRYNRSRYYVDTILKISDLLKE